MTDRDKVYKKVLKVLKMLHPGHLVTLAMLVAGIDAERHSQPGICLRETWSQGEKRPLPCHFRLREAKLWLNS